MECDIIDILILKIKEALDQGIETDYKLDQYLDAILNLIDSDEASLSALRSGFLNIFQEIILNHHNIRNSILFLCIMITYTIFDQCSKDQLKGHFDKNSILKAPDDIKELALIFKSLINIFNVNSIDHNEMRNDLMIIVMKLCLISEPFAFALADNNYLINLLQNSIDDKDKMTEVYQYSYDSEFMDVLYKIILILFECDQNKAQSLINANGGIVLFL